MTDPNFMEKRLDTAWVEARRDDDGLIRVTWLPHERDERGELSGRTYTPGDEDLPRDYPTSDDLRDYIAWAERQWGP